MRNRIEYGPKTVLAVFGLTLLVAGCNTSGKPAPGPGQATQPIDYSGNRFSPQPLSRLCSDPTSPSGLRGAWRNAYFVRTINAPAADRPQRSEGRTGEQSRRSAAPEIGNRGTAVALGLEPQAPGPARCLFLTAGHVVEGAQSIFVSPWSPTPARAVEAPAREIWSATNVDSAIVAADLGGECPLPPAINGKVDVGAEVYALGQPDLYIGELTKGVVSGYRNLPPWPMQVMRANLLVEPGYSGGPALTASGEVAGVVVARSTDTVGFASITPICDVLAQAPPNLQVLVEKRGSAATQSLGKGNY